MIDAYKIDRFGFEIEGEWLDDSREFMDAMIKMKRYGVFKGDGSINHCGVRNKYHLEHHGNYTLREFASKPFKADKAGVVKASHFFRLLKSHPYGYHWNKSSGMHVHVSFLSKDKNGKKIRPPEIFGETFYKYFIERLNKHHPEVIKSRGVDNQWASMRVKDKDIVEPRTRYLAVNFEEAWQKFGTIEFRIYPSSTPDMMYKYLKFTLETVNMYLNMKAKRIVIHAEAEVPRGNELKSKSKNNMVRCSSNLQEHSERVELSMRLPKRLTRRGESSVVAHPDGTLVSTFNAIDARLPANVLGVGVGVCDTLNRNGRRHNFDYDCECDDCIEAYSHHQASCESGLCMECDRHECYCNC